VALAATCVVAAQTARGESCPSGGEAQAAVRRTLDDFGSAYVSHDVAVMNRILGEEFVASRQRENMLTRPQYLEAMNGDRNSTAITRADELIRQYGCVAVATHRTTRLAEQPYVYRITDVLTFRDGRWVMVNRHVTQVVSPSPAPSPRP
jgi:ketosteroid isomerase-like protein